MNTITQQRKPVQVLLPLLVYCAVAIFLLGSIATHAQLVNGDFESNCGSVMHWAAFQGSNACVTGPWFVSHGSPDIEKNVGGNTTNSARMWATHNPPWAASGEGLFVTCPTFQADVEYRIRFRYYVSGEQSLDHIYVFLANGLVHNSNVNLIGIPVPGSEKNIIDIQNPTNDTWTEVDVVFSFPDVPVSTYSQLWFYPMENDDYLMSLYLDDVSVNMVCTPDITYNNFAGVPSFTEVSNSIEAFGSSAVSGGQQVTYQAGYSISLSDEFHADPTGTGFFHAYIAPCTELQSCDDNGVLPKQGDVSAPAPLLLTTSVDNYPNPFTGRTTISYTLAESGPVALVVTNVLGEEVMALVQSGHYNAGKYSMEFDGSSLVPGVYFLTLQSGTTSTTRKMVITR